MLNNNSDQVIYREKRSLVKTCRTKAKALEEKLNPGNGAGSANKICIGFHLRHVFDTAAPSVGLNINPDDSKHGANTTIEDNRKYGLQTLNHVLDTLYYKIHGNSQGNTNKRDDSNYPKKLCIRINFAQKNTSECHVFDRIAPLSEDNNKWKSCHYSVLNGHIFPEDKDKIKDFASGVIDLPWEKPSPEDPPGSSTQHPKGSLFEDFTCGAEKLCKDLGIDHSLSAYRVITAALYQLGTYTTAEDDSKNLLFGPQTVTLLMRSEAPFSVAVGVTLIAKDITEAMVDESKKFLKICWNEFNKLDGIEKVFDSTWAKIEDSLFGRKWWDVSKSPNDINLMAQYLRDLIPIPITENFGQRLNTLQEPLAAFVYTLQSFCGERLEGRPVCFGFILGNPGLLTHTPREQPFALVYEDTKGQKNYKFFTRDELPKQVHLAAMPAERAVVIPYCGAPDSSGPRGKLAAFALEFDEAMDEFRARPWSHLWSEQFIPYLYYTERFPWAVAAYVGPGAEIRLFVRGKLVAYHHEKGWLKIGFEHAMVRLKQAEVNETVVRQLLEVALQMSRFSKPDAKGGMLIYIATQPNRKVEKYFQSLTDNEPLRGPETPWLTQGYLIRGGKLDYAVARTLLQAALLDGTIVVAKATEEYSVKVHSFGQRVVNTTQASSGPKSGTRRAAAEALMKEKKIPKGSVAIAVSSDGPIRIWAKPKSGSFGDPVEIGIPL
jgi:hypothetical protein